MNRSFEKKGIPHHPPRVVNKCPDCNKNSLIIDKYARLTKLLTIKVTKLTDKLKAAGHRSNSSSERSINSSDQPKEGIV